MYFELMESSLKEVGRLFSRDEYDKFVKFKELLKEWNKKVNLTAITEDEEIITKHFIDSIKCFKFQPLEEAETIIDVGTGAGFPGIPIKIVDSKIKLTLLDSLNKRLNFLREVVSELNLADVEFVHARAEDGGRNEELREKFDIAVSRAVGNMTLLSELCLPYVKLGGYFIALKGPSVEDEINEAKHTISLLGGKLYEIIDVEIESTELNHKLVVIKKVKNTPKTYPRSSLAIKKSQGK